MWRGWLVLQSSIPSHEWEHSPCADPSDMKVIPLYKGICYKVTKLFLN